MLRLACLLAASPVFALAAAQSQAQSAYETVAAQDVMVTMRDGVRLATNVYRPGHAGVPAEGKFPVLLERTPYDKSSAGSAAAAAWFVARGYVAVIQDVRGRYHSEGRWRP